MKCQFTSLLIFFFSTFFSQSDNVFLLDNWITTGLPVTSDGESVFNEVWGFVQSGKEYAVLGSTKGTHIFQISDDDEFILVDFVQGKYSGTQAVHRDYHDLNGFLYAVCDEGNSSLQIMDLSYLPDSISVVYDDSSLIIKCHNIFIDSATSKMYACGVTNSIGLIPMSIYDISDPVQPIHVGDYPFVSYVHDVYARNDTAFLNCGSQGLRVVDFSNPSMPLPLGSLEFYTDKGYNHSGWLSEDGNTYVLCDETPGMRTKVLDVSDLSDIKVSSLFTTGSYEETLPHNVILKNGIAYLSYYNDGLQIFDVRDIDNPKRIGYFDTYQGLNENIYRGVWGVYPNLPSGRILASDRKNGLFLFGFNACPEVHSDEEFILFPNPAHYPTDQYVWFFHKHVGEPDYVLTIYNAIGQKVEEFNGNTDCLDIDLSKYTIGAYIYHYSSNLSETEFSDKFIVK